MSVSLFFQLLANGVMAGGMYALVASGLTLTLGVLKVLNFAQGDFLMLGAYLTYAVVVSAGLPWLVALLVATVVMALLGVAVYFGLLERASRYGFFNPMLVTVFLATIIEQVSVNTFASQSRVIPPLLTGVVTIGNVTLSQAKLLVIGCSVVVLVALYLFMKRKLGKAMLASSESHEVASLMGINPRRVFWVTMAVGCGLSGLAGAIVAPVYGAFSIMGATVFPRALLVLMLGGMGSMSGALISAFIIGIVGSFAYQYVGSWDLLVVLGLVGLVIYIRPGGLLGKPMPLPGE